MTSLDKRLRDLERQQDPEGNHRFILVITRHGKDKPTPQEIDAEVERRGGRGRVCVLEWDAESRTFT